MFEWITNYKHKYDESEDIFLFNSLEKNESISGNSVQFIFEGGRDREKEYKSLNVHRKNYFVFEM